MSANLEQFTKIFTRDEICLVTCLDSAESLTQFLKIVNDSRTNVSKKQIRMKEKVDMLTALTLTGNDLNIRKSMRMKFSIFKNL